MTSAGSELVYSNYFCNCFINSTFFFSLLENPQVIEVFGDLLFTDVRVALLSGRLLNGCLVALLKDGLYP